MVGVTAALAQSTPPEGALTVGLRNRKPHVEFGTTFLQQGDLRAWVGVGSAVTEGGELVGSFAALYKVYDSGFKVELGGGYRAQNVDGQISGEWDLVAKFSMSTGQGSALSFAPTVRGAFLVQYQKRY